jgi:phage-related minor tail protein
MAETISEKLVVRIAADTAPLTQALGQAGRELSQFTGITVAQSARSMTAAFAGAFGEIARNAGRAAKSGESAIEKMVDSILRALERIAIRKFIVAPLSNFLQSVATAAVGSLLGRAAGGPVAPGTPYLVGERGPEVFVPSAGGEITGLKPARARPQVVVHIHARDAQSVLKSESQISAMLTRAVARGQRNL